jgi:iron-sulfur cluster repair protein YtfE (RIC family)
MDYLEDQKYVVKIDAPIVQGFE